MLSAAKEETFSAFGPWCAETCISASECEGEKPHQGVAGKNPALHQGITWSNSTTALGLRGARLETRIRSRCTGKERDAESGLDYFGARYNASTIGRFMTPDPSNVSVDFWMPQTWNRYSYALNNPLKIVDRNGLWPTDIHNEIIDQAFPGLSQGDRLSLKDASYSTDYNNRVDGHDPQDSEVSYVHGMSDGTHNQDPSQAQQEGDAFIAQNEHDAQEIQAEWVAEGNTGIAPAALTAFGNALHTIEDRTSPAHVGNQPWYGTKGAKNKYRALQHVRREARINNAQMNASTAAARQAFRQTFGDQFEWLAIQQRQKACVTTPGLNGGPPETVCQ